MQQKPLMCSIEQCNGAGDCRKSNLIGGTMCPAFKESRDELKTTRARANVLRECLTNGDGFDSPDVKEILDSCLACKGCKSECPSNVDMTRIRAEVLQQIYDRKGIPFRSFAVARMALVEKMGSYVAPLYNFFAGWGLSSTIIKKIVRFAPQRAIPKVYHRTFKDEYPDLVPADMRDDARYLAKNCLLYDEFIMREVTAGRISSSQFRQCEMDIWLHGHCHQKALVGVDKTAAALRLIKGATVHVIPSGCCGMAGSFGYEKEHYKTSLAIGEMVLFPAVRKAVAAEGKPAVVAAPGTSCRQQILDGTGVKAVHPIVILEKNAL